MSVQSRYETVQREAMERMRKSEDERREARDLTEQGEPLKADQRERTIARIMAVGQVDHETAVRLTRKQVDPHKLGLVGDTASAVERIQGKTTDFVGVAYVERAWLACQTVARVINRKGEPVASGFLVSDRLFLTNNHVIASDAEARHLIVQFHYELDLDEEPRQTVEFELDPRALFVSVSEDDLDFTLVAIGSKVRGEGQLTDFSYCPLSDASDKHKIGEYVSIIQHPNGDYKQIVLRENMITYRGNKILHYEADTDPGSSGSPVFNDQWEVVALHHAGAPSIEVSDAAGRNLPTRTNEGVRISKIVETLKARIHDLDPSARQLLAAALASNATRPHVTREGYGERAARVPRDVTFDRGNRRSTAPPPIEVIVRIDGETVRAAHSVQFDGGSGSDSAERVRIDGNYENRKGYDPGFLGVEVSLPEPPNSQEAARVAGADRKNPFELKYEHFSIIMNQHRRMAFLTAVNIDGKTWRSIDRGSGLLSESLEGSETWTVDPRIDSEAQLSQDHFSQQRPTRLFDRGHLVRRQDPTWGDERDAVRANADTFHFTNCSTQAARFNQSGEWWQGLEQYVLDNAREEDARLCLFNGPVFLSNDPGYRDIQVPRKFWKVLARMEAGQLLASAFIADQSEMLTRIPERLMADRFGERFSNLGEVAHFQTTVAEIENLTGLDFGRLRDADTFRPGRNERTGGEMRRVHSLSDLQLGLGRRHSGNGHGERIEKRRSGPDYWIDSDMSVHYGPAAERLADKSRNPVAIRNPQARRRLP